MKIAFTTFVLIALALMAPSLTAAEALPIIPGAAGFGMETPAGSGRHLDTPQTRVIKVTNLNTEGPGSLRAALEAEGPRVVVFEVSGNIDFTPLGGLTIRNPYVTVAGQTAPSPGITLKACQINIGTHDVLLQHIRIRVGDLLNPKQPEFNKAGWSQWSERDNMKVSGERIVIDHCSFSWATDENVQSRASRATFSNCMFTECLNSPRHHKGGHSKGLLILDQSPRERVIPEAERESRHVAVIGNLFAYNADRNPQASGGAKIAVINNFVYGATERPGVGVTVNNAPERGSRGGEIWATVVGNHFDDVPAAVRMISRPEEIHGKVFIDDLLRTYTPAERRAHEALIKKTLDDLQFNDYLAGKEWAEEGEDGLIREQVKEPWKASHMLIFRHWMGKPIDPMTAKATEPPLVVPGLKIMPATEVREHVLANAGARPADRDPVDARVVEAVRARKGGILKSQEDVGGWPELAENRRELTLPDNPNADDDGDGYTNLEEWLHTFAAEVEGAKTVVRSTDLGWTAGQDVSDAFAGLLKDGVLKPGVELRLEHTYRLGGSYVLPDNVTISAVKGGGFDVIDAKENGRSLFTLGNGVTLHNLTILYLDTPEMGGRSYKHGVDFYDKKAIAAHGKRDILIKNCRLEGMVSNHLALTDCDGPRVIGCQIIGGFWAVVGSGRNLVFKRCLFEKSSCDNFKGGADGALFEDCVFQDTCRDGIDTTGGLNDTVVRNCIFRRLGCSGLDLKSHYQGKLGREKNVRILIEKCLFTDVPNAVVLTTLDDDRRKGKKDLLTAANMKRYAPHDIDINDCIFGHVERPLRPSLFGKDMDPKEYGYGVRYPNEGEHMRIILLKDAYNIRYRDARLFGDRIMPVLVHSIGGGKALSKEAADSIDRRATGNILDEPAPAPKPGDTSISFACGPQPLEK